MSEWNGVPLNPEEPGYHWVKGCDGEDTIVFWRGHGGDTHYENGDLKELDHWSGHPMWIAQEWSYLGPVLMPDEAAALQKRVAELEAALATARREGLEEAAQDLEGRAKMLRSFDPDSVGAHWAWHYAAAIRAALEEGKE